MGMYAILREVQAGDLARLKDVNQVVEIFGRGGSHILSLEKAWHGLDELLTTASDVPELNFIMVGGTPVGTDLSYGPPRLLDAELLRRLDTALRAIDDDQLWAGFDPERFEEEGIYPGIWDEPVEELREEYVGYFHDLQAFVQRVAASGGQILVVIS